MIVKRMNDTATCCNECKKSKNEEPKIPYYMIEVGNMCLYMCEHCKNRLKGNLALAEDLSA